MNSQSNDVTVIIKGREDLLLTLETSHQIFKDMRRRSADAQKAYAAMSIMLRCVKKSMQHAADLNGSGGQEFNTTSDGKMTSLWLVQATKSAGCSFTTPV